MGTPTASRNATHAEAVGECEIEGLKTLIPFHKCPARRASSGSRGDMQGPARIQGMALKKLAFPPGSARLGGGSRRPSSSSKRRRGGGEFLHVRVVCPPFGGGAPGGSLTARRPARTARRGARAPRAASARASAASGAGGPERIPVRRRRATCGNARSSRATMTAGQLPRIIEAMKMENETTAKPQSLSLPVLFTSPSPPPSSPPSPLFTTSPPPLPPYSLLPPTLPSSPTPGSPPSRSRPASHAWLRPTARSSARSAGRAPAARERRARGGEGSAITETVSATLGVSCAAFRR